MIYTKRLLACITDTLPEAVIVEVRPTHVTLTHGKLHIQAWHGKREGDRYIGGWRVSDGGAESSCALSPLTDDESRELLSERLKAWTR